MIGAILADTIDTIIYITVGAWWAAFLVFMGLAWWDWRKNGKNSR